MRNQLVYFIQAEGGGPIKIGRAKNVGRRLRALQTSSSVSLRCLGTMLISGHISEQWLHAKFRRFRLHGEWFRPAPDLLEYILLHGRPFIPEARYGEETEPSLRKKRSGVSAAAIEAYQARAIPILVQNGFSEAEIQGLFGISRATYFRRMRLLDRVRAGSLCNDDDDED